MLQNQNESTLVFGILENLEPLLGGLGGLGVWSAQGNWGNRRKIMDHGHGLQWISSLLDIQTKADLKGRNNIVQRKLGQ